jgi:hypothetical protein
MIVGGSSSNDSGNAESEIVTPRDAAANPARFASNTGANIVASCGESAYIHLT